MTLSYSAETCSQQTSFIFFNGVQTTLSDARISTYRLSQRFPATTPSGEHIEYRLAYNFSAGFEDFVETFDQRFIEQQDVLSNRFELFFDAIHGNDSDLLGLIETTLPELLGLFNDLKNLVIAAQVSAIGNLLANPPTSINYINQKNQIDTLILHGEKLILFAHSQGNLFANAAYQYILPQVTDRAVKLIHVAPASPTTHGPHTLANLDLVIGAVKLITGGIPDITDTIPIPPRPADEWGKTDWKGHGLWPIYLNTQFAPFSRIQSHITDAINTVQTPPVLNCVPPTPPSLPLGALPQLLTVKFAGVLATTDSKCQTSLSSQIVINNDGAVVGTGCYEVYSFPAGSSYTFDQAGSLLYFGTYLAFLDIHYSGNSRVDLAVANAPNGQNTITGGGFSTVVRSITIDKVARLNEFLAFISGKSCTVSYVDTAVSQDSIVITNAHVQVTGNDLAVVGPNGTIANASLSRILGDDFLYEEAHYDNMTAFPGLTTVATQHFDATGAEHNLKVFVRDNNKFEFGASDFLFPSSIVMSLGCVAS